MLVAHDTAAAVDPAAREVVAAGRRLAGLGLVLGSTGNVSARVDETILITPTRVSYGEIDPADVVAVSADGAVGGARRRPSSELGVHLAIYRARPDVRAVVHTHSPHATAWSVLGRPLPDVCEDLAYYAMGCVRVADWAPSGSPELARRAVAGLGDGGGVLLARHGVVTVGPDLRTAVTRAQVVEHQAHVAWLLERMDGQGEL